MKNFPSLLLTLCVFTIPLAAQEKKAAETAGKDWVPLLSAETKSLDENWTTTGNWMLMDGVATLTPREGETGWSRWTAYLWSKKKYTDFEIEFDYRVKKGGNSGFYFRVGDVNDPVAQGIEVQIYDSAPGKPENALTDHDSGGIIPGLKPRKNAAKETGEWNKMKVRNHDGKIIVTLNGVTVNTLDVSEGGALATRPETGPIGFQDHALPISLRNIRIREL